MAILTHILMHEGTKDRLLCGGLLDTNGVKNVGPSHRVDCKVCLAVTKKKKYAGNSKK